MKKIIKKLIALFNKFLPYWLWLNAAWGTIAGGAIFWILNTRIGAGPSADAIAAGVSTASKFAGIAPILGIGFGIALFLWLSYWDLWSIRKFGKIE